MGFTADDFKGTARAAVVAQINRGATMPEQGKPTRKKRAPGAGKTLEKLVADEQKRILAKPAVVLTFVRQEARWLPDHATGKSKLVAMKGPCDAFGTYRGSGRSIVFDMKECADTVSFDANTSALKEHQVSQLIRQGQAESVAGLLILQSVTGEIRWLSWTRLVDRKPTYPWKDIPCVGSLKKGTDWTEIITADVCERRAHSRSAAVVAATGGKQK